MIWGRTNPTQTMRYQLHNHLGSAALELDDTAQVISYEEYHPYGTTAYQAKNRDIKCAAKRYRYTGMERDEESGLEYHSARYYLPWLGRWGNCDPTGLIDGSNVYRYTLNSPTMGTDKRGHSTDQIKKNKQVGNKAAEAAADVAKLEKGVENVFQEVVVQAGKGGTRVDQIIQKLSQGVPDLVAEEIKTLDASKFVKNGVVDAQKLAKRVTEIFKQVYKHNFALFMEDFLDPATGKPITERLKIFLVGMKARSKQ